MSNWKIPFVVVIVFLGISIIYATFTYFYLHNELEKTRNQLNSANVEVASTKNGVHKYY